MGLEVHDLWTSGRRLLSNGTPDCTPSHQHDALAPFHQLRQPIEAAPSPYSILEAGHIITIEPGL